MEQTPGTPAPPPPAAPQPAVSLPPAPPRTSGLAIASLICGFFGCCCIPGLLGLIFGIIGLGQIKNSRGRLTGQGLAVAGIVVSIVMLVGCLVLVILYPVFHKARVTARGSLESTANVMKITAAVLTYAHANKDTLPPMRTLGDLQVTVGQDLADNVWLSPRTNEPYSVNPSLSDKKLAAIPDPASTVVVYEGTPTLGSRIVGYLDGKPGVVPDAQWPAVKAASRIP